MKFALCFTNFGPYHLARLRALASQLRKRHSVDRLRGCGQRANISVAAKPFQRAV